MNTNELTPTQRVNSACKTTDWASGERVVSKSFALELAAELERVQKENRTLSSATIMQDYLSALKERDDIKRQVEELKEAAIRNSDPDLIELLRQLRAENAELLKDRERLDWLESSKTCYHVCIDRQPDGFSIINRQPEKFAVRTAIDQAMKGNEI